MFQLSEAVLDFFLYFTFDKHIKVLETISKSKDNPQLLSELNWVLCLILLDSCQIRTILSLIDWFGNVIIRLLPCCLIHSDTLKYLLIFKHLLLEVLSFFLNFLLLILSLFLTFFNKVIILLLEVGLITL